MGLVAQKSLLQTSGYVWSVRVNLISEIGRFDRSVRVGGNQRTFCGMRAMPSVQLTKLIKKRAHPGTCHIQGRNQDCPEIEAKKVMTEIDKFLVSTVRGGAGERTKGFI